MQYLDFDTWLKHDIFFKRYYFNKFWKLCLGWSAKLCKNSNLFWYMKKVVITAHDTLPPEESSRKERLVILQELITVLHGCNLFFLILINPFQPSVAFHIETCHLICRANQMTGFWWNATLGGYGLRFSILLKLRSRIIYNTLLSRIYQENYFWQQEMAKRGMLLETGFWTGVKNSCEKCELFTCQSLCGILCWREL